MANKKICPCGEATLEKDQIRCNLCELDLQMVGLADKIRYKVGITGNYYFTSPHRNDLLLVCHTIGKAESSIYLNKKRCVWAIRVKDRQMKKKVKKYFERDR